MKKLLILFAIITLNHLNGQITLEHTFNITNTSNNFIYADIGNNDYKYIVIDYIESKINIYNLDYSPFLTNISTPLPLNVYDIGYITKNLFDCDDSNIEFLMYNFPDFTHFYIYRTDGTELFHKENVVPYYCFGCNDGWTDVRPIIKTPNGTKLVLTEYNNSHNVLIYSLCGNLPLNVNGFSKENNYLIVYPTPGSTDKNLNFKLNLNDNYKNIVIKIYDTAMKLLDTIHTDNPKDDINRKYDFSSGIYFYQLISEDKIIKTGKFSIK